MTNSYSNQKSDPPPGCPPGAPLKQESAGFAIVLAGAPRELPRGGINIIKAEHHRGAPRAAEATDTGPATALMGARASTAGTPFLTAPSHST